VQQLDGDFYFSSNSYDSFLMKPSFLKSASRFFATRPSLLFLIDGIGAFLSGILLFLLHKTFKEQSGLSNQLVYSLITVAFIMSAYSITCYRLIQHYRPVHFLLIACLNGSYILALLTLLLIYVTELHVVLQLCFFLESILIGLLLYWEVKIVVSL
jgi:hypothetical protein